MLALCCSFGLGVFLSVSDGALPSAGYLFLKPEGRGKTVQPRVIPYAAREGDLVFYDDYSRALSTLFALAGTRPPLHMGIVVKKRDGALAVLEAGPDDRVRVELLDLTPRLHQFRRDFKGTITIRRCKVPLNREKSAALTRFAQAQNGKPYALLTFLAQGTRFRVRGLMEPLLAKTDLNCDSWICSELAVASGTVAGLFDARIIRSNATYPCDLVNNRRHDLGATWHDPAKWQPASREPK